MPIRIWSAGCSSGQEPYSMAMVLAETIASLSSQKVEIWASDLSLEMLKIAAGAIYTTRDVQGVSPARLRRFFLLGRGPREGSFRVVPEIRDLVKFRHIDLRNPIWAVPNDFPIIFCRNVSIYFAEDERLTLLEPPGAAPAAGRLAGHGQRRDPAGSAAVACESIRRRCFRRRVEPAMAPRDRQDPAQPTGSPEPLEVLVVDDSAVVRQRLKSIIESDPRFRVVLAADPYEAVASAEQVGPRRDRARRRDAADGRPDIPAQADAAASDAGRALHGPGGAGGDGA